GELEEAVVQRMAVGQFLQRVDTEDRTHLRLERGGEQAVDIVVAVIDEHKATIAHVTLEVAPFLGIELDQLVPGQVAERRAQHLRVGQRDHVFVRVHAQRGVVHQRGDQVGRHARIHVPVAGVVFEPGEPEVVTAGLRKGGRYRRPCGRAKKQAKELGAIHETGAGGWKWGVRERHKPPHLVLLLLTPHSSFLTSRLYTASDNEVKVKSRSFIGGIIITKLDSSPATRTGLPSSSMLLSMITGDSLKRKFFTGYLIWPFSM